MLNKKNLRKSFFFIFLQGFVGGLLALSTFYYLLLFAVTHDPIHPFNQFGLYQPWMGFLIIGFGIQMGLFWMMKKGIRFSLQEKSDAKLAAGAGTTVSGVAMVACCAHHAVDLLPILGLSAAAVFLGEYQEQLLMFGVVTNLAGIILMLWFIIGRPKPKIVLAYLITNLINSQHHLMHFLFLLLILL